MISTAINVFILNTGSIQLNQHQTKTFFNLVSIYNKTYIYFYCRTVVLDSIVFFIFLYFYLCLSLIHNEIVLLIESLDVNIAVRKRTKRDLR